MSAAIGKLLVGRGRECPHTRKGRVEKKNVTIQKIKQQKNGFIRENGGVILTFSY